MVHWSESFWGDGNRGFELLANNVKNGAIAIEEFQRFLNESSQNEANYCKNLSRLQAQFIKIHHVGTFTPIWNLIRDLLDKVSSTHQFTASAYQDLLRDVHQYQDVFPKRVKLHLQKDADILRTGDLITQLTNATAAVNKAKEQYHSLAVDYERAKRLGTSVTHLPSIIQDNSLFSARMLERLEKKHRQAQDDYKLAIDKYNTIRNEYEKRFHEACTKYHDFEINHIEKMLAFSLTYSQMIQRNSDQIRMAESDFNQRLKSFTGTDLLHTFVEQKKTGLDRPAALQFEDLDPQLTNSDPLPLPNDSTQVDQLESSLPSSQGQLPLSSQNGRNNDPSRGKSPTSTNNQQQTPTRAGAISPTLNSATAMSSNHPSTRSQDSASASDQTSNPFDLKIRKPKFPGFFGSNRKEKKAKKSASNLKSSKLPQAQQPRDGPSSSDAHKSATESKDFVRFTGSIDDITRMSSYNSDNGNASTRESNSLTKNNSLEGDSRRNGMGFSSMKASSSSDTSDDDDDPMVKIDFKINPKLLTASETPLADEDHQAKIMNAMRLVEQSMGNIAMSSRGPTRNALEMNKSASSEPVVARIPPPVPSRSLTTRMSSPTTINIANALNAFPPGDDFTRSAGNVSTRQSVDDERLPDALQWSTPSTEKSITTSVSSTEDDAEVASSFPTDNVPTPTTSPLHLSMSPQSNSTPLGGPHLDVNSNRLSEQRLSPSAAVTAAETVPLAIAFQETIQAMMTGDKPENWTCRITGEMLISFPASIFNALTNRLRPTTPLEFRLRNLDNIANITLKSESITQMDQPADSNESSYSFDMTELNALLRRLQEKAPSSPFFNLSVLNYEVKHTDASNIPIQLTSQWSRTLDTISMNIHYQFHSAALPDSIRLNNDTVIVHSIILNGQEIKASSPAAEWSTNEHKLWWRVPYVVNGMGTLSATIATVESANDQQVPSLTTWSTVNAYFLGEHGLFSPVDVDITSEGYRVSLMKKKILCGKYQSEPDDSEPSHLFQQLPSDAQATNETT